MSLGLSYLVKIDNDGKLRWSHNNELVDTTAGRWKDTEDGITPVDSPDDSNLSAGSSSLPAHTDETIDENASDIGMHYNEPVGGSNKATRAVKKNLTLKGMLNKLLQRTIRKNTWIYVSDKHCKHKQ
jgi:hypothetical protein